jgi:hypothetical protein
MENMPESNNPAPMYEPKRHKSSGGAWWALVLILAGVILLVQNLHLANFEFHWWALFIFIPVLGSLSAAWESARRTGRFSSGVAGALGSAVVVGTVAVMLLFGLDWSRLWPLMLIAPGVSSFLSGIAGVDPEKSPNGSLWLSLSAWVGLGLMALGTGFLANSYPIPALQPFVTGYRWWAIPIFFPGIGALVAAAVMFIRNRAMTWSAWMMLLIAVFTLATATVALLGLDWNLLFPVVLIACGVVILAGLLGKK